MNSLKTLRLAALTAAATLPTLTALAETATSAATENTPATAPTDPAELKRDLDSLRQKLAVLERNAELKDEAAAAKAKEVASVKFDKKGVTISSADQANSLRFRGLVQTDARVYFDDGDAAQATDKFILRRARPIMEATFARDYDIILVPEFGVENPSAPFLLDAYLNAAPAGQAVQLQIGKQRSTIGLEMNQADPKGFFTERALPTQLTSNRDLGVALHGKPFGDTLSYKVGLFNGAPDGASPSYNGEFSDAKSVAGLFLYKPFADSSHYELSGLGVGFGADWRDKTGTATNTGLFNYQTDAKQSFYTWSTASGANGATISDGQSYRYTPHAYWYAGPFGVMAEYVVSANAVSRRFGTATASDTIVNSAWHVGASWVFTGENAAYDGTIPDNAVGNGGIGAWELVARVSGFDTDDDAFTGRFVNAATTARRATAYAVGLNWYLTANVRFSGAYTHTDFKSDANATATILKRGEDALLFRAQLLF